MFACQESQSESSDNYKDSGDDNQFQRRGKELLNIHNDSSLCDKRIAEITLKHISKPFDVLERKRIMQVHLLPQCFLRRFRCPASQCDRRYISGNYTGNCKNQDRCAQQNQDSHQQAFCYVFNHLVQHLFFSAILFLLHGGRREDASVPMKSI